MTKTLEVLPGEGEIKTETKQRTRQECENCGEIAHYKHTFLLPNARSNPNSSAYGRDDCSWSEDAAQFSCADPECHREMRHMEGFGWCATFPAIEQFAHMFLYWKTKETSNA